MDFKPPDNAVKNAPAFHDFARPHRFPQGRNNESPLIRENHQKVSVQDRLGNSMGGNGNRGDNFNNRNRGSGHRNFQNNHNFNGPSQWQYNRKRNIQEDGDQMGHAPKRWKQHNQKSPYKRPQTQNLAQARLKNLRRGFSDSAETLSFKDDMSTTCASDISEAPTESLTFHVDNKQIEEEATDITVEVVNNQPAVEEPPIEEPTTKFKMVLTPKLQNCIRVIQEKRKEKQVIIPYPVKPNVTMMSTHERFSLL